MLALRLQQLRGLARLAQLGQAAGAIPGWQQQAAAALHASSGRWAADSSGSGGGITGWLTSKLAGPLSGMMGKGDIEDLDLETFAKSIKQARRLGGLTGFVHGTSAAGDGAAQGTMRMFEQVIDAMTPDEKKDLALFDAPARARVAQQVGATTSQVDDCIARYLWTRQLTARLAQLKKEGKPMPSSIDELERTLGTWRQYKTQAETADGGTAAAVPLDHVGHKGRPCALAGQPVSRNTKCPATKKAFKACCGKTLKLG